MKKAALPSILTACLLFTGCGGKREKLAVSDQSSLTKSSEASADISYAASGTENSDSNNSAPSSGRYDLLADDWSNWRGGNLPGSWGGALNLFKADGSDMWDGSAQVEDGVLSLRMAYRIDLGENDDVFGEGAKFVLFCAVNGQVCDFELNGEKSQSGIFQSEREINKEYDEPLVIRDCGLVSGENSVGVYLATYFPQVGHIMSGGLSRPFRSDTERKANEAPIVSAEELDGFSLLTEGSVGNISEKEFVFERIKYDSQHYSQVIKQGGVTGFELVNRDGKASDNICILFRNGELVPAWNGCALLRVRLAENDVGARLPFVCKQNTGEYMHLGFVRFDLNSDFPSMFENLFYIEE